MKRFHFAIDYNKLTDNLKTIGFNFPDELQNIKRFNTLSGFRSYYLSSCSEIHVIVVDVGALTPISSVELFYYFLQFDVICGRIKINRNFVWKSTSCL